MSTTDGSSAGQLAVYATYVAFGLMALFLIARPWRRFLLGVLSVALGVGLLGYTGFPFPSGFSNGWLNGMVKAADSWPGLAIGLSPRIQVGASLVIVGMALLESSTSLLVPLKYLAKEGSTSLLNRIRAVAGRRLLAAQLDSFPTPIPVLAEEQPDQGVIPLTAAPTSPGQFEAIPHLAASMETSSTAVAEAAPNYLTHVLQVAAGQLGSVELRSLAVGETVEFRFTVEQGETRDIGFCIRADNGGCVVDLPHVLEEYASRFAVPLDGVYSLLFDNRSSDQGSKTVNLRYRVYWSNGLQDQPLALASSMAAGVSGGSAGTPIEATTARKTSLTVPQAGGVIGEDLAA